MQKAARIVKTFQIQQFIISGLVLAAYMQWKSNQHQSKVMISAIKDVKQTAIISGGEGQDNPTHHSSLMQANACSRMLAC